MFFSAIIVALLLSPFLFNILKTKFQPEFLVYGPGEGIIIITGASSGIGRHAAEHLAQKGYIVYAGVRKEKDAQSIRESNIPTLHPIQVDVTDHDSCVGALSFIEEEMKRHGVPFVSLVNNAGISRRRPAEFHEISDARKVFDTNFFGMMDITQQFLPLLRESGGRIVMISSLAGELALHTSGIYSASKFAMEAFSDSLRREVKQFNVGVSVVQPGFVKTSIFQSAAAVDAEDFAEKEEKLLTVYGSFYTEEAKQKRLKNTENAWEPVVTTEAIVDALTNVKPKIRYPVAGAFGLPASIILTINWLLPDELLDLFISFIATGGKK